jgi:hypothetical protein
VMMLSNSPQVYHVRLEFAIGLLRSQDWVLRAISWQAATRQQYPETPSASQLLPTKQQNMIQSTRIVDNRAPSSPPLTLRSLMVRLPGISIEALFLTKTAMVYEFLEMVRMSYKLNLMVP